ncbi:transcription factor SPN1 [Pseudoscourfieldia marina]
MRRGAPQAEEAEEEEAGVERIFIKGGNKKKKKEKTAEEVKDMVIDLLTKMDMAADKDEKSNQEQKPCIAKLGLMNMVYEQLTKRKYQAEYIDHGVLGVLKEWLKPMPDGSLPNVLVRTKVLGILEALPINLELPDRKEQLRSSQLGKLVMFLSINKDETPDNRKRATQLVQRWARPILELSTRYADMKATERVDLSASAAETAAAAGTAGGGMQLGHGDIIFDAVERRLLQPKPGDDGYCLHAAVPPIPKLDYSYEPTNNLNMEERMRARGPAKEEMSRLQKTLKDKSIRKRQSTRDAIAKVSIEGRNMHT